MVINSMLSAWSGGDGCESFLLFQIHHGFLFLRSVFAHQLKLSSEPVKSPKEKKKYRKLGALDRYGFSNVTSVRWKHLIDHDS